MNLRKQVSADFLAARDFKIAFCNGCFDLIHLGHVKLFQYAAQFGRVVAAVNSDASVKRLKGDSRPVNCLADRMALLCALDCVDYVIAFEQDTPARLILETRPDFICKGGDYRAADVVGADIIGVDRIKICPTLEGHSSSRLIGCL